MKLHYILLISVLITATACKDCPVRVFEVEKDFKGILVDYNLPQDNIMGDKDTLKIEILDTNIFANYNRPLTDLVTIAGVVSYNYSGTSNHVIEWINRDLFFEVNPNNKYELWVWGFQANLDSLRRYGGGRFLYYFAEVSFSSISDYYYDNNKMFSVEPTKN